MTSIVTEYDDLGRSFCKDLARIVSTVCKLRALQRHVDLQRVFVKIGDSLRSKSSLVEFLESRRFLRKSTTPENCQKSGLLSLAIYNPFSLHIVDSIAIPSGSYRA